MNKIAPDALRLVPEDVLDRLDDMMCDCKADGSLMLAESVANEHGEDLQMLLTAYRNLAASPAVQPAAGREEIARAVDFLTRRADGLEASAANTEDWYEAMPGNVREEMKAEAAAIRTALAAISTPAQASGEPVAYGCKGETFGQASANAAAVLFLTGVLSAMAFLFTVAPATI